MNIVWILLLVLFATTAGGDTFAGEAGKRFWQAMQPLCGKAFEGRLVEGTEPSDAEIGSKRQNACASSAVEYFVFFCFRQFVKLFDVFIMKFLHQLDPALFIVL